MSTTIEIKPRISTGIETKPGSYSYVLHFRAGNRAPMQKHFIFNGDLPKAIERAKLHCTKMDYRFCGCYPFMVDLDEQEKRREDNLGFESL